MNPSVNRYREASNMDRWNPSEDMETKIQDYLRERFGPETKLVDVQKLGKGIHGMAYRLEFRWRSDTKQLIMKGLFPSGFGHDHFSDRAQVLLLAHDNYNHLPRHIRAYDVVGEGEERLISLQGVQEFYILMDEASGRDYFQDLDRILKLSRFTREDRDNVQKLARLLVDIHGVKYEGENSRTLYRRRIRDLIGHGECIMGIIDSYNHVPFATDRELVEYASLCLPWWGKIRDRNERLCRVHGDYHPGNIWFEDDEVLLLDRSRGSWGEPADDVACLAVNYIYFALKERGCFDGPFAELFRLFLESYFTETEDRDMLELIQPFLAFRVLVLANPDFYPGDSDGVKRALLNFGASVLQVEKFDVESIPAYLGES
jgi:hypothetical protein